MDSEAVRREALNTFPWLRAERTITVPPAISQHIPSDEIRIEPRQGHLLFVGNLEPRKNLHNLLIALEHLDEAGIKARLRLVGPHGWRNRSVLELIRSDRLRERVEVVGYVSDEDLRNEYRRCRAFVYPSVYEGFGIPVLEALAESCMVVTSRGTVMQEVAGPAAAYFDPHDPSDIAASLAQLYSPKFDVNTYLQHAKAVLALYSWEQSALRQLDAFRMAAIT